MRRINKLEADLVQLAETRSLQRKGRGKSGLASVAIVGYTNAGKSTLLNRLTDSGVLVENRLFATLDPTTRRLALPGGEPVLLSDTVGFINRLPHGLVESFKGTLEVAAQADYLVHVVDSSAADPHRADRRGPRSARRDRRRPRAGAARVQQGRPRSGSRQGTRRTITPARCRSAPSTGEGVDEFLRTLGDRLRLLSTVHEFVDPVRPR